jgi:hypothetical protein
VDSDRNPASGSRSTFPALVATRMYGPAGVSPFGGRSAGVNRGSVVAAPITFTWSASRKNFVIGSPYPAVAGTSFIRIVYAVPSSAKNTTWSRVLPGITATTSSPSRTRVDSTAASRPTRLSHPSRVSTTLVFSRTMYASSLNVSTSSSDAIRVLRRSGNFSASASSSPRMTAPQLLLGREERLDPLGLLLLLRQLVHDLLDFHLRDLVELRVEDRADLLVVELEGRLQLLGRVRLAGALADDLDRAVQRVEDDREPFEDVDPLLQLPQLELEPPPHRGEAEVEEVPEHLLEVQPVPRHEDLAARPRDERREVVGERALEVGVLVEVRHHQVRVGPGLHLQHQPQPRPSRSTRSTAR